MATAQKINSKTVCTDWGKIFLFQDSMPCPALQRMRIWRKYFIKLNQECHQRRGIHQHVYKDVSCGMLTVEHFVSSARSSLRNQMQVQVRRRAIFSLSPMPQFHNSRSKIASMSSMPLSQCLAHSSRNNYNMIKRTHVPRRPCWILRWNRNRKLNIFLWSSSSSYSGLRVIAQVYWSQEKAGLDYPDNLNIISASPSSSLSIWPRFWDNLNIISTFPK